MSEVPAAFDPARYRMTSSDQVDITTMLTNVPVRRPKRTEFFRVHPGAEYSMDVALLTFEDGLDKESYLVAPDVRPLVEGEYHLTRLHAAITKQNVVFLLKIKLTENKSGGAMMHTALEGAEMAKNLWVKMPWNAAAGNWDVLIAKGDLGEPDWPSKSMAELMGIAFRDRIIDSPDHPVVRDLGGEI